MEKNEIISQEELTEVAYHTLLESAVLTLGVVEKGDIFLFGRLQKDKETLQERVKALIIERD